SGLRLLAPHVNISDNESTVESGAIRIGLSTIKHLTAKNRRHILARRPFRDFEDFLEKVSLANREMEALVLCGACDGLNPLAPETYPIGHEELLVHLKQERSRALEGFVARHPQGIRGTLYSSLVRIQNELTFLEMHLHDHPMRVLREEAARAGCVTTAALPTRTGQFARIDGLVAATRRLATRGGQIMQ